MGNKRKFLPYIDDIIVSIEKELNKKLTIGEGFSGTGIVSRLFKTKASQLYVNDIASYSKTLNCCYLANITNKDYHRIKILINQINTLVNKGKGVKYTPFVSKYWSPEDDENIKEGERVYFTEENGKRIDMYRHLINQIPENLKHYLLAPLLVECSMHNNTNGQFSAFYKDETKKKGKYGGKNSVDIKRITKQITLKMPIFYNNHCKVFVSQSDTKQWATQIPELDLYITTLLITNIHMHILFFVRYN